MQSLLIWRGIFSSEPAMGVSRTTEHNAAKGLWLVSLYAALEYSINSIVSQTVSQIESSGVTYRDCNLHLQSILHRPMIQSLRDCKESKSFLNAQGLILSTNSSNRVHNVGNPLSAALQNVDGSSFKMVTELFGIPSYSMELSAISKLENLRERRNAISHGRETASDAGQRFNAAELKELYDTVDFEIMRLHRRFSDYLVNEEFRR